MKFGWLDEANSVGPMKARVDAPRGAGCQWQWFLEQREIGRGLRFRKTLPTPESLLKGFINDQLSFIRNVKGSLNCRIEVSIESTLLREVLEARILTR